MRRLPPPLRPPPSSPRTSPVFAADANSLAGIHWWGYYDYNVIDLAPRRCSTRAARQRRAVRRVEHGGHQHARPRVAERRRSSSRSTPTSTRTKRSPRSRASNTSMARPSRRRARSIANVGEQPCRPVDQHAQGFRAWWQLGNEPNIIGEGVDWTNGQVTPAGYAQVYKDVRNSIQSNAQVGSPGAHKLMIAPVSPGGVIPGVRWMSGNDWLGQTIDAIKATDTPIDGVALHAYDGGGGVQQFLSDITQQLEVIDAKGCRMFRSSSPSGTASAAQIRRMRPPRRTPRTSCAGAQGARSLEPHAGQSQHRRHHLVRLRLRRSQQHRGCRVGGYSIKYWKTAGNRTAPPATCRRRSSRRSISVIARASAARGRSRLRFKS